MVRLQAVNQMIDRVRMNPSVRFDLASAAKVTGYSPHHFHRVFNDVTGETLQQFTSRVRLANSARLLRTGWDKSLLELALGCGFNSAEDFSRNFRSRFGCSPRDALKGERVYVNGERFIRDSVRGISKRTNGHAFIRDIRIVELPPLAIVYGRVFHAMENPDAVKKMLQTIFEWAVRSNQLDFKQPIQMVGIGWDDFDLCPLHHFMYDAGIVVKATGALAMEPWMNHLRAPGGKYVVMDFEGDLGDETDALDYLYHSWLPRHGCFPAFTPSFEVFSNEQSLHDWNNMKLKLVVPITSAPLIF